MSTDPIRRDFLKLSAIGLATSATTGALPALISEASARQASEIAVWVTNKNARLAHVGSIAWRLWTTIGHRFIAMGAAGWHICFDVLDRLPSETPIGRIVGPEAMKFGGCQRLNAEYAKQFGIETPNWPAQAAQKS